MNDNTWIYILLFLVGCFISFLLLLTIKILLAMSEELNGIKQLLTDTQEVVTKVSKDVDNLHQRINEISGEVPTAEEWAEVKSLAQGLKDSLVAVDEKTEDQPAGQ